MSDIDDIEVAHDCNPCAPYDEEYGIFKFKFKEGRMKPVSFLVRLGKDVVNGGARGLVHGIVGGSVGMEQCIGGEGGTGEIVQNIIGGRETEDGNNDEAGRMEAGNAIGGDG